MGEELESKKRTIEQTKELLDKYQDVITEVSFATTKTFYASSLFIFYQIHKVFHSTRRELEAFEESFRVLEDNPQPTPPRFHNCNVFIPLDGDNLIDESIDSSSISSELEDDEVNANIQNYK